MIHRLKAALIVVPAIALFGSIAKADAPKDPRKGFPSLCLRAKRR
jgi:hypothetical protein